jgi:DNA repair ATPase RecN
VSQVPLDPLQILEHARAQLVPKHGVLFGMTGAGKSVIVADLLAQIGHRFRFRLIVEEGLSDAVLTQTQGCEPVIINPNGFYAIVKEFWRSKRP